MNTDDQRTISVRPGSGISGIGGAILALMFFLPWFSACGINVSGKDLAFGASLDMGPLGSSTAPATYPWIALVLLCGIAAVALALLDHRPSARAATIEPPLMLGAGVLACLLLIIVLVGYASQASSSINVVQVRYGLPGALLSALMILGGALYEMTPGRRAARERVPLAMTAPPPGQGTPPPIAPPPGQNRARLHIQSGPSVGQAIEVRGDRITIGRSSDNRVPVSDSTVSRVHAVIRYAQGRYYLQDQQSAHGTLLNGQPIQASVLHNGDLITVGETIFEFRTL